MSDKKRATFIFLHFTDSTLSEHLSNIPALDSLVSEGNTHMLALRSAI